MGKKILIGLGLLILVILGVKLLLVPTAKVSRVLSELAVDAVPGSVIVQAEYEMEIKSEIPGRVLRSELDPGKHVKMGDILLEMDPGDINLEIEKLEGDLEAAKKRVAVGSEIAIQLEQGRADLANYERLFKSGNLPEADFRKYERGVQQIEQKHEREKVDNAQLLQNLEIALKAKLRQRSKMTMRADFDGVVSRVYARPGDLITSGNPVAALISTSRTVEAKISEENFTGVKLGQRAVVRLLGQNNKAYDATVSKILPTADPATQRYIVHLDVKVEPELLIPGSTGDVSIIIGERQSPTVIPRRAVFSQKVLVVREGKVVRQHINYGFVGLNKMEIVEGLQPDELVIVEELDRFRDGDRVRTVEVK